MCDSEYDREMELLIIKEANISKVVKRYMLMKFKRKFKNIFKKNETDCNNTTRDLDVNKTEYL